MMEIRKGFNSTRWRHNLTKAFLSARLCLNTSVKLRLCICQQYIWTIVQCESVSACIYVYIIHRYISVCICLCIIHRYISVCVWKIVSFLGAIYQQLLQSSHPLFTTHEEWRKILERISDLHRFLISAIFQFTRIKLHLPPIATWRKLDGKGNNISRSSFLTAYQAIKLPINLLSFSFSVILLEKFF